MTSMENGILLQVDYPGPAAGGILQPCSQSWLALHNPYSPYSGPGYYHNKWWRKREIKPGSILKLGPIRNQANYNVSTEGNIEAMASIQMNKVIGLKLSIPLCKLGSLLYNILLLLHSFSTRVKTSVIWCQEFHCSKCSKLYIFI